jgi:tyrosine-protein kinase Etk/Wzc
MKDKSLEQELYVEKDETSDFAEYWRVVMSRKWAILFLTVSGMLVSVVYFSMMPNRYSATVKILIEKPQSSGPRTAQDGGVEIQKGEDYYATQIAILTGSRVRGVVQSELTPPPGFAVNANRERNTRIIALTATHTHPGWAANIANKFAEAYIKESAKQSLFIAEQVLQWIPQEDELLDDARVMEQREGFDKEEYAESLAMVMNDPIVQRMREERLGIKKQLVELSQKYKPQHPSIVGLNTKLEYVEKEQKDRVKAILQNLRAKLSGHAAVVTDVRILERATPPSKPYAPDRPRGILIWTLFASFGSAGLFIFLDKVNQKVRTEYDLRPGITLPFLGYVPQTKEIDLHKKDGVAKTPAAFSFLEVLEKNRTLADAVASIRTHILFSMPYEKSKRIMVTSTLPSEGKSTVAALLALSFQSLGRNILLVDADMRRPFLHNFFGIKNEKGLTDYLIGAASVSEIVRSVPGTPLKIITTGAKTPNPSELLGSERFKELLDTVSKNFDRLVIDIAPVLYMPDALIVAKHVHSSVLVCGSGMVHKKVVHDVKEKFESIGHSFIGIIINGVDYEKESYKYAYFKDYKKHYATEKAPAKKPA